MGDIVYNGPNTLMAAVNRSSLDKLQVGMSRQQAIDIMGEPHSREAYASDEYLFYMTENTGEMTPVAIVDGKVAGWGRNYSFLRRELIVKQR